MDYTVWELMDKFGSEEKFNIITDIGQITGNTPVSKRDVLSNIEDRKSVLDALELSVYKVDFDGNAIYAR